MGSDTTHCARPRAQLRAGFSGCSTCGRIFAPAARGGHELTGPVGVRVLFIGGGQTNGEGYRAGATDEPPVVCLERAWRVRWAAPLAFSAFVSVFLALWGGAVTGAALGLIGGTLGAPIPAALAVGPLVLALSVGAGYLAVSLALNRTRIVVTSSHLSRYETPITWRWRAPVQVERALGDSVRAVPVGSNDIRNLSARWPAPRHHQVELVRPNRESVPLVEQIGTESSAERIRQLVEDLLAASGR